MVYVTVKIYTEYFLWMGGTPNHPYLWLTRSSEPRFLRFRTESYDLRWKIMKLTRKFHSWLENILEDSATRRLWSCGTTSLARNSRESFLQCTIKYYVLQNWTKLEKHSSMLDNKCKLATHSEMLNNRTVKSFLRENIIWSRWRENLWSKWHLGLLLWSMMAIIETVSMASV